MTAWTTISNALVAVGAKPFATTVQALRDNVAAAMEGATGAPVNTAHWHPYNKVTNDGANTGLIYDFAVSGAVATIVSPDFTDGWEYRFRFNRLSPSSGTPTLRCELYLETSAAYSATFNISSAVTTIADNVSGHLIVNNPRVASTWCLAEYATGRTDTTGVAATLYASTLVVSSSQKRLRARFSWSAGNNDLGEIYMDRRRVP